MRDENLRLEVMRLPDYGLVFIELTSSSIGPHAQAVLPSLGRAFIASWHTARRHGGLGGLPMLTPPAGAGWLLERAKGNTLAAKGEAGGFARDALGAGESAWWRQVGAQLSRIPSEDDVVCPSAY
ncbi:hypothetical protein LZC95_20450 [Pendulispora brunnea]|uniref:Uncharacterized protein n=1 Tax=Pendulispora brunnea TaxID=2905690 RepID=A0ABZ2KKH8_9BACT